MNVIELIKDDLEAIRRVGHELFLAKNALREKLKSCRYKAYTQESYITYVNSEVLPDAWQYPSGIKSTDTVYVSGRWNDSSDYAHLYCNNLIDIVELVGRNGCKLYEVNGVEFAPEIASFIRRNVQALREHKDSLKLQELLATGEMVNVLLVRELLRG